jgi:hypothetical protein
MACDFSWPHVTDCRIRVGAPLDGSNEARRQPFEGHGSEIKEPLCLATPPIGTLEIESHAAPFNFRDKQSSARKAARLRFRHHRCCVAAHAMGELQRNLLQLAKAALLWRM